MYVDVAMHFGIKQSVSWCQFCTDAITFLMTTKQHWMMKYLDDVIWASDMRRALGLPVNNMKVVGSSELICLGIEVNARYPYNTPRSNVTNSMPLHHFDD